MEDKNKKIITLLGVFTIIFTVIGSSLAYLSWQTSTAQQTSVTFTTEADFSCSADGGGNITSGSITIVPTTCDNSEHVIKRTISTSVENKGERSVYLDLWLDINNLGSYLSESENFNYILSTSNSCTDEESIVESGNFYLNSTGEKKRLFRDREYPSTSNETYYLYIWLDAEETEIPPTDTTTREFDLSLNGNCSNTSTPEEPVLDENLVTTVSSDTNNYVVTPLVSTNNSVVASTLDTSTSTSSGMIPVVISNDGTVKTVYKDSIQWYDYDQKEWANIVLVSEGVRSTYIGTQNVVVDQDDILAYYVWIPRYKYKIWTTAQSSSGNERTIDIVFEDLEEGSATGTKVGEYLTHPAFNFGGEPLAGIWVGKFETTQGTWDGIGTDNPTILPNVKSWRAQNVSTQFQTSLKFAGGSMNTSTGEVTFGDNIYGLTGDAHMMKNSEWAAVAYLSQSIYGKYGNDDFDGINKEIYKNNSSSYYTGRSEGTYPTKESSSSDEDSYKYNVEKYGTGASTTGNIYGIYDMSGGAREYVMSTYNKKNSSSGFVASWFTTNDNSKYFDNFEINSLADRNTNLQRENLIGYGFREVQRWYSDGDSNYDETYSWILRSAVNVSKANSGVFYWYKGNGTSNGYNSFRVTLVY